MENIAFNNLESKQFIKYIAPTALFITLKILCDPLFLNTISIDFGGFHLVITQSSLVYAGIFVVLDVCSIIYGLKNTYKLIILAMVMDGIYSFGVYSSSFFHLADVSIIGDNNHIRSSAIHQIAEPTILLFLSGMLSTFVTNLAEVSIFSWIYKKLLKNNIFFSTIISVAIVILINNIVMLPIMIKDKSVLWTMYWSNFTINMIFITAYTSIYLIFFKNIYTSAKVSTKG
ncbi:VUT family protein [Francisella sciaenopsi]|uniref:PreQ0 transporter n=1 Tax=Francisella sciaenopsi TaxID=3055034 RepID=A0ABQ6PID5_9GAMM